MRKRPSTITTITRAYIWCDRRQHRVAVDVCRVPCRHYKSCLREGIFRFAESGKGVVPSDSIQPDVPKVRKHKDADKTRGSRR